jgi:hypothetical protein
MLLSLDMVIMVVGNNDGSGCLMMILDRDLGQKFSFYTGSACD